MATITQQISQQKIISCGVYRANLVQKEQFQLEEQVSKIFSELALSEDSAENYEDLFDETLLATAMRLVLENKTEQKSKIHTNKTLFTDVLSSIFFFLFFLFL